MKEEKFKEDKSKGIQIDLTRKVALITAARPPRFGCAIL